MNDDFQRIYFKYFWWIWQSILILISGFFLALGIEVCIYCFRLNNPFHFILSFFASNLIIMVSVVIMAGIIYRMIGVYRLIRRKGPEKMEQRDENDEMEE